MSHRAVLRFSLAVLLATTLVAPAAAQVHEAPMPHAKKRGEIRLGLQFGGPNVIQVQYELKIFGEPAIAPMPREKAKDGMTSLKLRGPSAQWNFVSKPVAAPPVPKQITGDFEFYVEQVQPAPVYGVAVTKAAGCAQGQCAPAAQSFPTTFPRQPVHGIAVARRLSPCDSMNFTWQSGPALAMPRDGIDVIGVDFDFPCPQGQFSFQTPGPLLCATPVMAPPHPLVTFTAVHPDGHGGWWVEPMRVPQPKHAMPANGHCPPQTVHIGGVHCYQPGVRVGAPATIAMTTECREQPGKLSGTWYRDLESVVVSATFSGDELKICLNQMADGQAVCVTITADYSITKEGLLHGVISGVDVDVEKSPRGGNLPFGRELAELTGELQSLVDSPFSFRIKKTSGGMMVSGLRIAADGMSKKDLAMAGGLFRLAANGTVPAPRAASPVSRGVSRCDGPECRTVECVPVQQSSYALPADAPVMVPPSLPGTPVPMMPPPAMPGTVIPPRSEMGRITEYHGGGSTCVRELPLPAGPIGCGAAPGMPVNGAMPVPVQTWVMEPMPQKYMARPMTAPPMPPAPVPMRLLPPPPSNVPPGEFGMMAEVFGQMVAGQATPVPAGCPQPKATYLDHPPQYFAPPQATGAPVPPVVSSSMPRMNGFQPASGCVSGPPTGFPVASATMSTPVTAPGVPVLTGTWYREVGHRMCVVRLHSDHLTMSFVESSELENGKSVSGGISLAAEFQMLCDGSTAVGVITSVDGVLEGDLPGDAARELMEVVAQFQKACEEKPFAMKFRVYGDTLVIGSVRMPEVASCDAQPSILFGGQYRNASNKPLPKARPAKPMRVAPCAAPCATPGAGAGIPGARPVEYVVPLQPATGLSPYELPPPPPAQPAPTRPNPALPAGRGDRGTATPSSDRARINELLYQSEGVSKIKEPWRRFWFQSQPSQLTPERIHGGIL